jgi:hypothetical protein
VNEKMIESVEKNTRFMNGLIKNKPIIDIVDKQMM